MGTRPVEATSVESSAANSTYDDFADLRLRRRVEAEKPAAQPLFRHKTEPMPIPHEPEPLVSPATDAAVATSFNTLFASRLMPSPEVVAEMTRDMLRPMLKTWLDDNLPVMVERLVRAEIERVARGGR
jgi:cell pole-organizing protein PopZ